MGLVEGLQRIICGMYGHVKQSYAAFEVCRIRGSLGSLLLLFDTILPTFEIHVAVITREFDIVMCCDV